MGQNWLHGPPPPKTTGDQQVQLLYVLKGGRKSSSWQTALMPSTWLSLNQHDDFRKPLVHSAESAEILIAQWTGIGAKLYWVWLKCIRLESSQCSCFVVVFLTSVTAPSIFLCFPASLLPRLPVRFQNCTRNAVQSARGKVPGRISFTVI